MKRNHRIEPRLDHRGEFDEVFVSGASIHVERMDTTGFWIGIDKKGFPSLSIRTGVHRGVWYFNVARHSGLHDALPYKEWNIQRPRNSNKTKLLKVKK